MSKIGRIIKGYFFWTFDRGSFHYDVMVSLILLFIFVAPRFVNFKDQPAERTPYPGGIVVTPEGQDFVYRVDASAVDGHDEEMIRAGLLRVIEPVSGEVTIFRTEPVRDPAGKIVAYRAWVRR